MAIYTDPARELFEVSRLVGESSDKRGADHLANAFRVDAWSTPFLRLLTCISERIDLVKSLLDRSSFDPDLRDEAKSDLEQLRAAFVDTSLRNKWNDGGHSIIKMYGERVRFLQSEIRRLHRYPKLDDKETEELVERINAFLSALEADTDVPEPAMRALQAGLAAFVFQLTTLKWCSAEYTLDAFRRLTQTYKDLVEEYGDPHALDASAWLGIFRELLTVMHARFADIKNATEPFIYLGAGYNLVAPSVGLPSLALPPPR